jgi:hypothetical protein
VDPSYPIEPNGKLADNTRVSVAVLLSLLTSTVELEMPTELLITVDCGKQPVDPRKVNTATFAVPGA